MSLTEHKAMLEALAAPMEFKWRAQSTNMYGANLVAYISARDVAKRLDEVFGLNWSLEFIQRGEGNNASLFARITVNLPGQPPIYREDLGTESKTEGEKGEVSDSFKRAAVQFGVGRFLYNLGVARTDAVKVNGKDTPAVDKAAGDAKDNVLSNADDLNAYGHMLIAAGGDKQKAKAAYKAYKAAGGSWKTENKEAAVGASVEALQTKQQDSNERVDSTKRVNDSAAKLAKQGVAKAEIERITKAFAPKGLAAAPLAKLTQLADMLEKFYLLHAIADAFAEDIDPKNTELSERFKAEFKALFGAEAVPTELTSANEGLKQTVEALKKLLDDIQKSAL